MGEQNDDAHIKVLVNSVNASKVENAPDQLQPIIFNLNVKLEEVEQSADRAVVHFGLNINTQPHLAKFSIDGLATVEAKPDVIDRLFQNDPTTQVPRLVNRVYKEIYTTVFILAAVIRVPAPSPGLLYSQKVPIAMDSRSPGDVPVESPTAPTPESTNQTSAPEVAPETPVEAEPAVRSEYPSQPITNK